jgi:hypothetical protein
MLKKGIPNDLLDVGFKDINKIEMFTGSIQIVLGTKSKD